MNHSYRVIYSKARGFLTVASEVTKSAKKKGVRTAVAAALVASFATGSALAGAVVPTGSAAAGSTVPGIVVPPADDNTLVSSTGGVKWEDLKKDNYFLYFNQSTPNFLLLVNETSGDKTFDKNMYVQGAGANTQATGIWVDGGTSHKAVTGTNTGTIYVAATASANTWSQHGMGAGNGGTAVNAGTINASGAHAMFVANSGVTTGSTITNASGGVINVTATGVGMELGGFSGNTANNDGTINVGKTTYDSGYTHGMQFETADNTFNNTGTISAKEGSSAIYVKVDATGSKINLQDGSKVEGRIVVAGTNTTINVTNNTDSLTIRTLANKANSGSQKSDPTKANGTTTLNVTDGSNLTLVSDFDTDKSFDSKLDTAQLTFNAVNVSNATLTNSDAISATTVTLGDGGTLNTKIDDASFNVGTVNLEAGSIFNILESNAGAENKKKEGNTYEEGSVVLNGGTINLKGGAVQLAGKGIDTAHIYLTGNAKVDAKSGQYKIGTLSFNGAESTANLTIESGADFTIGTFDWANATTASGTVTNSGSLTINGVTLPAANDKSANTISITNTAGIYTTKDVLGTITVSGSASKIELNAFGTALQSGNTNGTIYETSITDLTKEEYSALETSWKGTGEPNHGNLVFVNAVISGLGWGDVASGGVTSPSTSVSVSADNGNATLSGSESGTNVVVSNVETGTATSVTIGSGDSSKTNVTLAGTEQGGVLFGTAATSVKVSSGSSLTLGYEGKSDNSGTVAANLDLTSGGSLKVAAGDFSATKGITLGTANGSEGNGGVSAKLDVTGGSLSVTGGLTIGQGSVSVSNGSLDLDYVSGSGSITLAGGATMAVVGNAPKAAHKMVTLDDTQPSPVASGALSVTSPSTFTGTGNLLALGTSSDVAKAEVDALFGDDAKTKNIYYVGKQVNLNGMQMQVDGSYGLVVDMAGVATTEGYTSDMAAIYTSKTDQSTDTAALTGSGATIKLVNITSSALTTEGSNKVFKLYNTNAKTVATEATSTNTVDYGTIFYGTELKGVKNDQDQLVNFTGTGSVSDNGTISFAPNEKGLAVLKAMNLSIGSQVEEAVKNVDLHSNAAVEAIITGAGETLAKAATDANLTEDKIFDSSNGSTLNTTLAQALAQYGADVNTSSNLAVTGGAFSAMMDINRDVLATIQDRMTMQNGSIRSTGATPWVSVIGSSNQAKKLYGTSGYKSELYGAMMGADVSMANGVMLGASFSVGTGTSKSVNTAQAVDNNIDFYGIQAYASRQVENVNILAHFAWNRSGNDLSAAVGSRSINDSLASNAYSFGLGAEYRYQLGAMQMVPHVGFNWTRLSMQTSNLGIEYGTMSILQLPIGVAFNMDMDLSNEWKVSPMLDLSYVPNLGDDEAQAIVNSQVSSSIRVVDTNPFQGKLGVKASNGAWTAGLTYGLTAGADSRFDNSLNLNVQFKF